MREQLVRKWLVAAVLVGLNGLPARAQNGEPGAPPPPESAAPQGTQPASVAPVVGNAGRSQAVEPAAQSATQSPVSIEALLKMLQAGVSKDVIKAYIDTAQTVPHVSAADLITLKEHNVPDELAVALMKREAELAAQARQASASNAVPAKVSGTIRLDALIAALRGGGLNGSYLDPEGYDYFRHYYLTPRAIASANERIFSSYPAFPGYPAYSFGYGYPWAFRPRFFAPGFPGP